MEAIVLKGGVRLCIFALCVVTASVALLVACVLTPDPLQSFAPVGLPKGLPLSSLDTIAFFVSSEITRTEADNSTIFESMLP
jgi:hypothetical protein